MHRHVMLILLFFCYHSAHAEDPTLDRVTALARTYFRDSAEVPMSVAVTTVVTDAGGKVKHRGNSTVTMIFNGYKQAAGKFSVHSNSGWFNTGALRDSLSGDLSAFIAALYLAPPKDSTRRMELRQPAGPGKPALVVVKDEGCPGMELIGRWLFPKKVCGEAQLNLTPGAKDGELMFQHFSFDSLGAPAAAKVAYLGDVRVLAFHAAVDFQQGYLPGDSRPYLWPREAVTSVTTNKGTVTITNRYSPKK